MPSSLTPRLNRSIAAQARRVLVTGQRFRRFDQIRQRHFWASQLFSPDVNGYIPAGEFDIFTTPPGQIGNGFPVALTERETNWNSQNRVPDNQNFEILEIGVTCQPLSSIIDSEAAFVNQIQPGVIQNNFAQNTLAAIRYLTNVVELGMVSDFAQASGPVMGTYQPFDDTTGGETRLPSRFASNGFTAPGLRRRFKIPILLQHGETFSFRFIVPRAYYSANKSIVARLDFWATESFVEKS